ncbi:MAG: hypothetical protein ACKO8S_04815, partial [Actinomycetota bacterium]
MNPADLPLIRTLDLRGQRLSKSGYQSKLPRARLDAAREVSGDAKTAIANYGEDFIARRPDPERPRDRRTERGVAGGRGARGGVPGARRPARVARMDRAAVDPRGGDARLRRPQPVAHAV